LAGTLSIRGRMRGLYQIAHPQANFAEGDTFAGSGEYVGRTFMVVKLLTGAAAGTSYMAVETTEWDTSA
jgi:hypothetical protein